MEVTSAETWLQSRTHTTPNTSTGWFRAGVGFYNKESYRYAVECFKNSLQLDPRNYNAYQIMARAYINLNQRREAIDALKQSVKLNNPSDWQLLVELSKQDNALKSQDD